MVSAVKTLPLAAAPCYNRAVPFKERNMIRKLLGLVVLLALVLLVVLKFTMPSLPPKVLRFISAYEPRAAVRGFLDAAKTGDRELLKTFASARSSDLSAATVMLDQLREPWSVGDGLKEGDSARVRVRRARDGKEFTAISVKEGGSWRVDVMQTIAENSGIPDLFKGLLRK